MFWQKFQYLSEIKGIKPHVALKEIGISSGSARNWKKDSIPNGEILMKIADYFEVSIDYLLDFDENSSVRPNSNIKVKNVSIIKKLNNEVKKIIIEVLGSKVSYSTLSVILCELEDCYLEYKKEKNDKKSDDVVSELIEKAMKLLEDNVMDDIVYNDFVHLENELYTMEDEYLCMILRGAAENDIQE